MFDWPFQLLNHSWVPWLTSGLILLWGMVQWSAMRRNLFDPMDMPLSDAMTTLEETPSEPSTFRPAFTRVDQALTENSLLGPLWSDYSKTLLLSEDDRIIHSTVRPGSHFTLDRLIGNNLEDRFYRAVPGFLIGSGFFFTFIGLIAALHFGGQGLASEEIGQARLAMQGLLHAAALKFLSSLTGFAAALLFSWGDRWHRHQMAQEVELFCQLLEDRFEHLSGERVAHEQLRATNLQNRHLGRITARLDNTVALPAADGGSPVQISFEPLLEAIHDEGERISRTLNEFTLEKLPEVLESRLQPQGDSIGPALERIAARLEEAISSLGGQRADHDGAGLSGDQADLLDRIARKLDGAVDALNERAAQPGPAPSLEPLIASVKQEGERLYQANEKTVERILGMARQQHSDAPLVPSVEFLDLLGRIAAQMETAVGALGDQGLQTLVETLRQEGEKLVHTGETVVRRFLDELAQGAGLSGNGLESAVLARLGEKAAAGDGDGLEPVEAWMVREREHWMQSSRNAMVPIMAEMAREMTAQLRQQRQEEMRFMERVAAEVNQSVADLNDKIGRATPISLGELVRTVSEKGERLHQGSEQIFRRLQATAPFPPPPAAAPFAAEPPDTATDAETGADAEEEVEAEFTAIETGLEPVADTETETMTEAADPAMAQVMTQLEQTIDALHTLSDRMTAQERRAAAVGATASADAADAEPPETAGLIRATPPRRSPPRPEAAGMDSLTEHFVARQNRYRRHYRTKIIHKSAS